MTSSEAGLHCPISLFGPQETKIAALSKAINAARTAAEKMPHARRMMDELGVLIACSSYDRTNHNCVLCRSFSELRLKTATLIAKVGQASAVH